MAISISCGDGLADISTRPPTLIGLAVLVVSLTSVPAQARPAQCFSTDDGHYACDFRATDKDGSFEVSAKGKPTIMLNMTSPGHADGYADFGTGRNVTLPGSYVRSAKDGACWINDDPKVQLCAR